MAPSGDDIRVLHVDDDPDFGEVAATLLEREEPRLAVETATGLEVALERIDAGRIDCVVSDYELPGRDGIELLQTVREDHTDLPFILFTGKGSEEVASEAISAGVTDYLQKGQGSDQSRRAREPDRQRRRTLASRTRRGPDADAVGGNHRELR